MLRGTVGFKSLIKGTGLSFGELEFHPNQAGVERVLLKSAGDAIVTKVYLVGVASDKEGTEIATRVNMTVLDRIAFLNNVAIEDGQVTECQFAEIDAAPGEVAISSNFGFYLSGAATVVLGVAPALIQEQLQKSSIPGEGNFGIYRSSRLSASPVEEFMHLYNVLLMILGDKQAAVDKFIVAHEPSLPQSPQPGRPRKMETTYTRLRNELGHRRPGVKIEDTKKEMAGRVGGLAALVKRAIELQTPKG